MNEDEAVYLSQLSSVSDIPLSLQHFHSQYEQAKAKLSGVAADTARAHKEHKSRLQRDIRETQKLVLVGEELLQSVQKVHNPPSAKLLSQLDTVGHATKISKYLGWLKFLGEAEGFLEGRVTGEGWRRCLPVYDELNCYCTLLEGTACTRLYGVLRASSERWYDALSATALRSLPVVNWREMTEEVIGQARESATLLSKISRPLAHGKPNTHLALRYLTRHFETQFKFHFRRKVKTNDISKPEWYFTKLLIWIREFGPKFVELFGDFFPAATEASPDKRLLFAEVLCELGAAKLREDFPRLSDALFTHYIDEVLKFHKELGELVTLSCLPTPLMAVFVEERTLKRWLQLETLSSFQFLSSVSDGADAFEERDSGSGYVVPALCVRVLTSVRSVGERVRGVPDTALHACFYSLQLDLLREFMVHLSERFQRRGQPPRELLLLLNSLTYTLAVVEEWSYDTHFIKVARFDSAEPERAPFAETVAAYGRMVQDSREGLESGIVSRSTNLLTSSGYFKQSWELASAPYSISQGCSAAFMELQQSLRRASDLLAGDLFVRVWSNVASAMLLCLETRVLYPGRFNKFGATQLKLDMASFCSLFYDYCSSGHFARLKSKIRVLGEGRETLRLWRNEPQRLQEFLDEADVRLEAEEARKIIALRTDVV